jgi:hypothetical protein
LWTGNRTQQFVAENRTQQVVDWEQDKYLMTENRTQQFQAENRTQQFVD